MDVTDAPAPETTTPEVRHRVGDPLPSVLVLRELPPILGLSYHRCWDLEKAGELARFELPGPRLGKCARYSGAKLQEWLTTADAAPASRFFGHGRRK
jgi:hypothetical protein